MMEKRQRQSSWFVSAMEQEPTVVVKSRRVGKVWWLMMLYKVIEGHGGRGMEIARNRAW